MKKLIVCDSGLGGLNVAKSLFRAPSGNEMCHILYYNAYPAPGKGFNTLSNIQQEKLFITVLQSMERFQPDQVLIACNTLSIIFDRLKKYYTPPFPVSGIVDAAAAGMSRALQNDAESNLLILGTKSTVESKIYEEKTAVGNIDRQRIRSLACPGLATLLESDPAALPVKDAIRNYALQAVKLFDKPVKKLYLGLCCTHFAFASESWIKYFQEAFACPVTLIDPNELMQVDYAAQSFEYYSRIDFFDGAQESMQKYFAVLAPAIAAGLNLPVIDENLFTFEE